MKISIRLLINQNKLNDVSSHVCLLVDLTFAKTNWKKYMIWMNKIVTAKTNVVEFNHRRFITFFIILLQVSEKKKTGFQKRLILWPV